MDRPSRMQLGALTIAATRPRMLARFYSTLLGWPYIREEEPGPGQPPYAGYALVCPPDGVAEPALNFEYDPHHRRPVWPSVEGEQTTTQHLDFGVDDLDSAVVWAIECGATLPDFQPAPSQHRVMIDPEGHPFCLCASGEET
ncbi:VOC family protein [Actinopolymorpha sp. B11F2]|uniref:VOC family protein n=1 Tax=Actinopolymorpha sp. B11F2 TaxID=3160862 RepID=UPI0032E3D931